MFLEVAASENLTQVVSHLITRECSETDAQREQGYVDVFGSRRDEARGEQQRVSGDEGNEGTDEQSGSSEYQAPNGKVEKDDAVCSEDICKVVAEYRKHTVRLRENAHEQESKAFRQPSH